MDAEFNLPPPSQDMSVIVADLAVKPVAIGRATALAPGFRFHPTDEELVSYYLKRKLSKRPMCFNAIAEVDIYKMEPWDLSEKSNLKGRDEEWYFYSPLDKKYCKSSRMNRATNQGYWKATGKDREIRHDGRVIAMKKTLVFHSGRAPSGERTNWVMHEYRLTADELQRVGVTESGYVLCRVFHKNNTGPPKANRYAPFLEEEWDDGEATVLPGIDGLEETSQDANAGVDAEENNYQQDNGSISKFLFSGLPSGNQNALSLCKHERQEDCSPVYGPFPLVQYKRLRDDNDVSSISNASENSARPGQDRCSSTITTEATKTTVTTNGATATAASALLEFSLSIEPKDDTSILPLKLDAASYLQSAVPPSFMKLVKDLQSEIHKISAERETLRLEMMSAQATINILQSHIDCLNKENLELKKSCFEAK